MILYYRPRATTRQVIDTWTADLGQPPKTTVKTNGVTTYPQSDLVAFGDSVIKSAVVKGDFVTALPYFSSVETIGKTTGTIRHDITKNWFQSFRQPVLPGGATAIQTDSVISDPGILVIPFSKKFPDGLFSDSDLRFCKSVADTKALAGLRRGLASLPMLYAERLQTLDTVKNRSRDIIDLLTKRQNSDLAGYRKIKGNQRKKRFAKKIANDHLELIFGILPVIDDLQGLCEFAVGEKFDYIKSSGVQSIVKNDVVTSNKDFMIPNVSWTNGVYYCKVTERLTYSLGVRTALRMDIKSELFNNLRQLGFNPIHSAYDLVPMSFVLGWFSNFSSWVASLDFLVGVEFRTGSRNTRRSVTSDARIFGRSLSPKVGSNWVEYSVTSANARKLCSYKENQRTVLTALPERDLVFQNNMSPYTIAASISLAVQKKLKIAHRVTKNSPFKVKTRKPINLPPIKYVKPT